MDLGLTGKVAMITGGRKGIGLETALQLAYEGAKIAIMARNENNLHKAANDIKEKTGGGGSIVNITTSSAKTPPASCLPTNVSRAAGLALTKAMSKDLAAYQIRVNTVCIG